MVNVKSKGMSGEREVIMMLQAEIDKVVKESGCERVVLRRNLEQVRSGGADVEGLEWIEVEVKRREGEDVKKWWAQVSEAARKSGERRGGAVEPVLLWRENRGKWKVRMRVGVERDGKWWKVPGMVELEVFLWWFRGMVEERVKAGRGIEKV